MAQGVCQVLVNTSEAFASQGSGIKSFSNSLLRAVAGSCLNPSLLLESYWTSESPALADTNAVSVYHFQSSSTLSKLKEIFESRSQRYLRPLRRGVPIRQIRREDPLFSTVVSSLRLNSSSEQGLQDANLRMYQGSRIFSQAKTHFARTRKLLPLELRGERVPHPLIYHAPMPFPIIFRNAKNITTVHDTISLTSPEFCLSNPGYENALLSQLLEASDAVHCISHFTAESVCRLYGSMHEKKIHVIPQSTPHHGTPLSPEGQEVLFSKKLQILQRFHATGEGYLLQLGTIEPKKNHQVMLEAFQELRRAYPKLRLLIIGKEGWLCDNTVKVLSAGKEEGVEWKGSVSRSTLDHYITDALALVFPSLIEGWGLPPLEAMACSTPAIVSKIPACLEACADAGTYVEEFEDPYSWANTIQRLLDDTSLYRTMMQKGIERATKFNQAEFFVALSSMYHSLL
jgi:glycosyltransferase involved in cell wall biosynthesis